MLPLALLKNTLPSHRCHFSETFCLFLYFFFFSPLCLLSTWWLATCRSTNHSCSIPRDERFVSEGGIWSTIFHCILGKKSPRLGIFTLQLHTYSYAVVVFDVWILLCSSQGPPRCYSDSEKKKISRIFLAGHASVEFADSDSVQCYEA